MQPKLCQSERRNCVANSFDLHSFATHCFYFHGRVIFQASSSVQEQVGELHKVVNDEVAPEWQKAVDAASNIMQTLSAVKLHDIAGTTSPDESD